MQNNDPENHNCNDKKSDYEINKVILKNSLDAIYNFTLGAYDNEQLNELLKLDSHSHSILSYDKNNGDYWNIDLLHNKPNRYVLK